MEKEVLGIYVSGHPLAEYEEMLNRRVSANTIIFMTEEAGGRDRVADGQKAIIGGIISDKTIKYTKNNKVMAFIQLEDMYGSVEVVVFPNVYDRYIGLLNMGSVVIVDGTVQISEDEEGKLMADKISPVSGDEAAKNDPFGSVLFIKAEDSAQIDELAAVMKEHKGNVPVRIRNAQTGQMLGTPKSNWVDGSDELLKRLKDKIGENNVVLRKS